MKIRKIAHPEDDTLESFLRKLVLDAARKLGWDVYSTKNSRRSPEGYPDLTMVRVHRIPGRVWLVYAELKRPKDTTTAKRKADQAKWLALLDNPAAGVRSCLWRLADWDSGAILEVLK